MLCALRPNSTQPTAHCIAYLLFFFFRNRHTIIIEPWNSSLKIVSIYIDLLLHRLVRLRAKETTHTVEFATKPFYRDSAVRTASASIKQNVYKVFRFWFNLCGCACWKRQKGLDSCVLISTISQAVDLVFVFFLFSILFPADIMTITLPREKN